MSESELDLLQQHLDAWCTANRTNRVTTANLTTMLTARPETPPVKGVLPVMEFEERLDLARKYVIFPRE